MIYNAFGIWNWNIQLVSFLVYLLFCLKIKFKSLWVYSIYVSFKWDKHIFHWILHMNLLIDGYVIELIYEYLWLYSSQDHSGEQIVLGKVLFYDLYG